MTDFQRRVPIERVKVYDGTNAAEIASDLSFYDNAENHGDVTVVSEINGVLTVDYDFLRSGVEHFYGQQEINVGDYVGGFDDRTIAVHSASKEGVLYAILPDEE